LVARAGVASGLEVVEVLVMSNLTPLILWHGGCFDGYTAAWIAERALGGGELVAVNYGEPPPDVHGRVVYVLDFAYPREVLERMHAEAEIVVVIDHHLTHQEALAGLDYCIFDQSESGASLTWLHFHGTREEMPLLVRYVRDRDLWLHALPESKNINAWIRTFSFGLQTWDNIKSQVELQWTRDIIVEAGAAIRRGEERAVQAQLRGARPLTLSGVPFTVANVSWFFSEAAGALAKITGAGAVWWVRGGGRVQWSLRGTGPDGVDVAAVAKAFPGGGGHMSAAGFTVSWEEHLDLIQNAKA
jgi:oligoribonuclease NrnB/cAMP/cGMP phosphodiesterase (DHH superfamily)